MLIVHAQTEDLVQRAVVATASLVSVPLASLATLAKTVSVSAMICNDYFAWTLAMKSDDVNVRFLSSM